jgi:hypothetical protein
MDQRKLDAIPQVKAGLVHWDGAVPMESAVTFLSTLSPCEYLPDRAWQLRYELVPHLRPADYMQRLQQGWRRFGWAMFRPECPSCRMCQSLRVPVATFRPNASQRSCLRGHSAHSRASSRHCGGQFPVGGRPQCPGVVERRRRTPDDHRHDDHEAPSAALRPPASGPRPKYRAVCMDNLHFLARVVARRRTTPLPES